MTSRPEPVRSYKRRASRVTAGQRTALDRLWPAFGLAVDGSPLDLAVLFGRSAPVVLEIGFGMGEATAAMAAADPERDVLAVDVHTPGQGNLLRLLEQAGLTNVRVADGDARRLLTDMLAPASLFAPIDAAELRAAARAELTGFWAGAVRKPHLWLQDVYVDLGLLTVARVEATVTEDRLLTKAEALSRLDRFGVPPGLVEEIARRRKGEAVVLTDAERATRAEVARTIVAQAIGTFGTAGR